MNENENTVQVSKADLDKVIALLKKIAEKPKPVDYPQKLAIVIAKTGDMVGVIKTAPSHVFAVGEILIETTIPGRWKRYNSISSLEQWVDNCDLIIYNPIV